MNVTEKIGEEYKKWGEHDKIFISAPTGAGKTYFVLHELLPHAESTNKKILFLVNRRLLKEQVKAEIDKLKFEQKNRIRVELYQTLENEMSKMEYKPEQQCMRAAGYDALATYADYDYVVCDECHYFFTDSNYNTNTALSYRWIQECFSHKVRIFMSATIKETKAYIEAYDEKRSNERTFIYEFESKISIGRELTHKRESYDYLMDKNYDYVDVHIIKKNEDITELILSDKSKWLIFIDSISHGRILERELKAKFAEEKECEEKGEKKKRGSVVMLTSDYENDEEGVEEVERIVNDNKFSAKVLISTPVMDNGVNIKDFELRNIILFADTEDEFIQMLGRKRKDDEENKVQLYLYKWNKAHFQERCRKIRAIQEIAENYLEIFWRVVKNPLSVCEGDKIRYYCSLEGSLVYEQHCKFIRNIFRNIIRFEDASRIFLVYEGMLYINLLAFEHLENLSQYYYRIIRRFDEEDEDAFLREQLGWLGIVDAEIERIILDSKLSQLSKDRRTVVEAFNQILNQSMNRDEAIEFKKTICEELVRLAEAAECDDKKRRNTATTFSKNDRPISEKSMKFLEEFCDIPFILERKKGEYTIRSISE